MSSFMFLSISAINMFKSNYQEKIPLLFEAVKNHDEAKGHQFKKTEEWATVEEMMSAHGGWCAL